MDIGTADVAAPDGDQTFGLEDAHRLAQGRRADVEPLGQVLDPRENGEVAAQDLVAQGAGHDLRGARRPDATARGRAHGAPASDPERAIATSPVPR